MILTDTEQKLLSGDLALAAAPYALTRQQRSFEAASQRCKSRLADLSKALQAELGRMLTDVVFDLDVNLCSGVGLENWLSEPGILLLDVALPLDKERLCYMSIDHQAVHNMADLCLGGQLTDKTQIQEKVEFSSSENRICCRLLQKQAQALMQLLFNQHLPLAAHLYKQKLRLDAFSYLPLKVRLILEKEAVSWFLWLPIELLLQENDELFSAAEPESIPLQLDWQQVPVRCTVEMARKQVTVKQLQGWLQGELLAIELFSSMRFQLGKQVLFHGTVAEEGQVLMFQITEKQEK
ncbi:MAG: FliM/FliN family flagellar motor switch protein [Gammaproteobacteria bacterium]|nr:FliM/FliN family flagellar motor switch protein [Gammaproteobacteria bacterium]